MPTWNKPSRRRTTTWKKNSPTNTRRNTTKYNSRTGGTARRTSTTKGKTSFRCKSATRSTCSSSRGYKTTACRKTGWSY